MITIDLNQYNVLLAGAEVLESSREYGPSVFRTDDGRIIKAFHRQRRLAVGRVSYANRFARHAGRLRERGLRSVDVEAMYRCPQHGSELVVYPMLPGASVRELAGTEPGCRALDALPAYLAGLHRRGVHFRGIHLGNLLFDDDTGFALIDIGYMSFFPWPLDLRSRASNFRNILRYDIDAAALSAFGLDDFMGRYFDAAALSAPRRSKLAELIARDRRSRASARTPGKINNTR